MLPYSNVASRRLHTHRIRHTFAESNFSKKKSFCDVLNTSDFGSETISNPSQFWRNTTNTDIVSTQPPLRRNFSEKVEAKGSHQVELGRPTGSDCGKRMSALKLREVRTDLSKLCQGKIEIEQAMNGLATSSSVSGIPTVDCETFDSKMASGPMQTPHGHFLTASSVKRKTQTQSR